MAHQPPPQQPPPQQPEGGQGWAAPPPGYQTQQGLPRPQYPQSGPDWRGAPGGVKARGLTGWLARRAARESTSPIELRVARLGVRSALFGALIGALGAGTLGYIVQVRAEANQEQIILIQSRQNAYAEVLVASADLDLTAVDYASVASTAGADRAELDAAATAYSDCQILFFQSLAAADLVATDDMVPVIGKLRSVGYGLAAELWGAHADNLSGADTTALDTRWDNYQTLSSDLSASVAEFTQAAREDIGSDG